jgi:4-hydroxy 2-oxovalerate aldolase
MKKINLLDVTLRDGGYVNGFQFSPQFIDTILPILDASGIEYVEVGYRNGSLHSIPSIGEAGLCQKNYVKKVRSMVKKAKISVMLHANKVNNDDILELKECGVDLVRICISKANYLASNGIIESCLDQNLEVSLNLVRASECSHEDFENVLTQLKKYPLHAFYLADSNGSLLPSVIREFYEKYSETYPFAFGFHAHDNLGLAQVNAIQALESGASFIDVSLGGLGKGIGNLKAEYFVAYLSALGLEKYDFKKVLEGANYVGSTFPEHPILREEYFQMGILNKNYSDLLKSSAEATRS